ncbi:Hsp70 ATPase ssa3, partial [Coemansia sp. RSA 2681]
LFETKCGWVLGTAIELIKDILSDSKVDKSEIDHVIVAGGLALIPKVQADISAFFDGKVLLNSISPGEVIVKGAAMHAAAVATAAAVLTEEQA